MTKLEIGKMLIDYKNDRTNYGSMLKAIDAYASTAKPNVSGDAFVLLTEIRQRLLIDINENGEPNSSMNELFQMWDRVNTAITANNQ